MLLRNGLHGLLSHILIKAGNEVAVCHRENFLPSNDCLLNLGGKQHAQIQHNLEEQVFWCTIFLDIICKKVQLSLLEILGAVINIFHIGGINSKYPEASVEIAGSQRGFFPDFLSGAADTLLSNVADGRITCFSSLAFFPCYLWQLNKYKFAVLFLFYIYFHNRMRSCC